MKKVKTNLVVALFVLSIMLSSCSATMHTVGTGGKGDCKSAGQYDATKKQMYLFWGLLPLNKVDSKDLAGGAQNYTVRTTTTFVDGIIAGLGAYVLGFKTQTIRVSKGDK